MKIKYLTWLHEKIGTSEERLNIPESVSNIDQLIDFLETIDDRHKALFQNRQTIYTAVNNEIQTPCFRIKNTDEISFFSAVVGG